MRNAGLDEAQARLKIAGRNINNLRYANDTTLMSESEEDLKSLLMKVKEQIDGETMKRVTDFIFLGLQNQRSWWLQLWNEKTLAPWKKSYGKPSSRSSAVKVTH